MLPYATHMVVDAAMRDKLRKLKLDREYIVQLPTARELLVSLKAMS